MMTRVLESGPSTFFEEFYPSIYRFVSRTSGAAHADVEDLVQETLLHAWKDRDCFRGGSSRLTWILAIAKNRIRHRGRKNVTLRNQERCRQALSAADTKPIPPDIRRTPEMKMRVREALEEIDSSYSEVLLLHYFHGLPLLAIAGKLAETRKAVESRLYRARNALRKRLSIGDPHDTRAL